VTTEPTTGGGSGSSSGSTTTPPGPPESPSPKPPARNGLGGGWSGTWTDSSSGTASGLSLFLHQQGSQVTGDINIEGTACLSSGVVNGIVSGTDVTLRVSQRELELVFEGTLNGNKMSGTYTNSCDGLSGPWSVTQAKT